MLPAAPALTPLSKASVFVGLERTKARAQSCKRSAESGYRRFVGAPRSIHSFVMDLQRDQRNAPGSPRSSVSLRAGLVRTWRKTGRAASRPRFGTPVVFLTTVQFDRSPEQRI